MRTKTETRLKLTFSIILNLEKGTFSKKIIILVLGFTQIGVKQVNIGWTWRYNPANILSSKWRSR